MTVRSARLDVWQRDHVGVQRRLAMFKKAVQPVREDCQKAVNLLNKQNLSGTKKAGDPAFNLAAQLLAAELNYTAGSAKTSAATTAINQAVRLPGKCQFDGSTHATISTADAATMNSLANTLDDYNNN
jgi:hypothetical protein